MTAGVALALYVSSRSLGSAVLATLATVLGLLGMWASLSARPQLVTFALTAITTSAWLRSGRDGRRRWWLIPLTWVWACSHGMWFVSPVIGIAAIVGLSLQAGRRRDARRLAPVAALSLGIGALTPVGPGLLLAPLSVSGYTWFVSEWDPPRLASPPVLATMVLLVTAAVVWARSRRRADPVDILIWLVAVGWALAYTRTVAVGAAMAAPLFVAAIAGTVGPVVLKQRGRTKALEVGVLTLSATASIVVAAAILPASTANAGMPTGLNAALDRLPSGSVVFNEYGFGGWLHYAHPDLLPVIDERTEVYSHAYIEQYLSTRAVHTGWSTSLNRQNVTALLVPSDSGIADAALGTPGWRIAGSDDGMSLIIRDRTWQSG